MDWDAPDRGDFFCVGKTEIGMYGTWVLFILIRVCIGVVSEKCSGKVSYFGVLDGRCVSRSGEMVETRLDLGRCFCNLDGRLRPVEE
jgi:hypothetical protein